MVTECLMMEDDNFTIAGQVGILDFSGVTLSHFIQFNPGFIKKTTMYQQDAIPAREKGSHFVKMPQTALTVFNLFMSFLNEKNRSRISIHGDNFDELYKMIPKEIMPTGELSKIDIKSAYQ